MKKNIPIKFWNWLYNERKQFVYKLLSNDENLNKEKIFLNFTRHTPTVISHGPAGLNGSVKGIGFIPKDEYISEVLEKYLPHIEQGYSEGYSDRGLKILSETVFSEDFRDKIDDKKLISLELVKEHSYENISDNNEAVLLFYQPPVISYEVRCRCQIHEDGTIHKFVNAQHDIYHSPNMDSWKNKPAYLFEILEIYDNSATKKGFGTKIY